MKPSMPGFCIPVAHVMPAGDSAIRGVGISPARTKRDAPCHERPDATGVDQAGELAARSGAPGCDHDGRRERQPGQVDGDRAFHPGHERTTGSPSGGVGSIVGASESHRSQSTRAGLNTGPSTQDRRLS